MPTKIEWTDETWNPVRGCSRVSEGCRNCYAERLASRFAAEANSPFHQFATRTPSGPRWTGKVQLIEEKLTEPLHWRKPRRIFVNSMSDLFHEALSDEVIDRVFAVMALCPQHTFQILTKRPARMREYLSRGVDDEFMRELMDEAVQEFDACHANMHPPERWPLPNVWLGVSVEDQKTADERIPLLLKTPAAVRFVSYEPALGPVDFSAYLGDDFTGDLINGPCERHPGLDWIIAGGESGPGARPPHPQWFRAVRDQCQAAGVAFFFKQWGEWGDKPVYGVKCGEFHFPTTDPKSWRDNCLCAYGSAAMYRVGKKAAGALLDGREWREFPKTETTRI